MSRPENRTLPRELGGTALRVISVVFRLRRTQKRAVASGGVRADCRIPRCASGGLSALPAFDGRALRALAIRRSSVICVVLRR
jgi:hypothetical protein